MSLYSISHHMQRTLNNEHALAYDAVFKSDFKNDMWFIDNTTKCTKAIVLYNTSNRTTSRTI
jgi:hypothetical protein